ncbi:MAG: sulfotransferase [Steroidobacteraceae bacterium]
MATPDIQAYQLMKAGRPEEALPFARQAVAGQRVCLPAHGMLATVLVQLGHRREADAVVSEALGYPSGSADAYDALAHVSMLLGEHERSHALYQRVVALAPQEPRFWYNLASSERSIGRLSEAEAACDRAIALDGSQYPSYLLRSELRVQSPDRNHVPQLRSELSRAELNDGARTFLGYALAKELDDLRQFDEAFRRLAEATRLRRRHLAYDVAVDQRKLLRIAEVFATEPSGSPNRSPTVQESERYIFIVGLPRSGTTLLEHILLGLPGVRSNGETDNFAQALLAAAPPAGSDVFARAAASDPDAVATRYARLADGDAGRDKVIDKQPMNYLYLGAIRRALPDARLVLVSRQPLDSCFAMYRTLFASAYPFSYDFDDLAKYYAGYERLMGHWRASFGHGLHEVRYEELVRDPATVCAAVAKYCGLQWDPSALAVHTRASVSLTASAAQIRRPIYGSSSGRWLHYRSHLQPLVTALRQLGVPLPSEA